ncbi:MAG: hypothetical protein NT123_13340 [Proteobacteria bacterium]|nr:hypothetical protein [Pseudomonadota bacterium]
MLEALKKAGAARLFSSVLVLGVAGALIALVVNSSSENAETPHAGRASEPPAGAAKENGGGDEAIVRRLRTHLERQPRDARGWAILARLQFEMDRFTEAAQAYERALALPSKVADDPAVWCEYADALGMTQGGKLAGKPRELIDRALAIKPSHPKALEMAGSAEYEQRDYAAALGYWQPLLTALEPGSQRHAELAAAIERAERLAKITIPPQRK